MAKPLKLDVIGDAASGKRALDQTADGLDKVGRAADDADGELQGLANTGGKVEAQIRQTEKAVRDLARELDRTGDSKLLKQLSQQQGQLRRLIKVQDLLPADADLTAAGVSIGGKLSQGISSAFASGGSLTPVLVAGAVAAAPVIASTLGAAVTLGVGVGAVAGGLALAAQDPRVQAEAERLGAVIGGNMVDTVSDRFVDETVLSMRDLEGSFKRILPEVEATFDIAAGYVRPLAQAIGSSVERLAPALREAAREAKPVVDVLSDHLPQVAGAIADAIEDISENSDSAAVSLAVLLDSLESSLVVTGKTVELLSAVEPYTRGVLHWATMLDEKYGESARELTILDQATTDYARASEDAAKAIQDQVDATDKAIDSEQRLRLGRLDMMDTLAGMKEQVEENGRSLDINTQAGRNNLRMVEDAIVKAGEMGEAAEQNARDLHKSGAAAEAAGAQVREQWYNELIKAARAAGLNTKQIEGMIAAARAADGTKIRIYHEQIFRTIGKPFSSYEGIGGNTFRGYSAGGEVDGPGAPGVDSVKALLAPREFVLTEPAKMALYDVLGKDGLLKLNRTGRIPGTTAGAAAAGGAHAGGWGGGEMTFRFIHEYPDGTVVAQQITKSARAAGQRDLATVFAMPAVR